MEKGDPQLGVRLPRQLRVLVEGGIYDVYDRFARGAKVFVGGEAERFLEIVRRVRDRDGWTVFAWALMASHYHLALRTGPVLLSRSMASVQSRFGQRYHRRWRSTGPLWQSRYTARLVEDSRYLRQLVAYIHLNPVTAGLLEDPAEHPHSGHRELLGRVKAPLIAVDEALSEYGETLRAARARYVRSLRAERDAAWAGENPGALPWWGRERVRPLTSEAPAARVDEVGRSTGLERAPIGATEFVTRSSVWRRRGSPGRRRIGRRAGSGTCSARWRSSAGGCGPRPSATSSGVVRRW